MELFDSLGLTVFVATIGINAGPSFIHGLQSTGLSLVASGVLVCAVPYLVTILLGRYVFRLHPGILLGICAGACTFSAGLAALQERAEAGCLCWVMASVTQSAQFYMRFGDCLVALVHKG